MTAADPILSATLAPLRELHLTDMLRRMARAIAAGAEVTPEPWMRKADGSLSREGALRLPARHDFEAETAGRLTHPAVATPLPRAMTRSFAPLELVAAPGLSLLVLPFRWEAAELALEMEAAEDFDAHPLRRWFLEHSQSPAEAPEGEDDLLGVVHSMGDPRPAPGGVTLRIDFGSAPIEAVAALAEATAQAGARRARLQMSHAPERG